MEISHVLLRCCLQVNSIIVCENERIPQRARESAFLGIVHFAHCQKLLACQRSLKRNNPSCHKYLPKKPFEQKRQNNRELFNRGC